MRLRVIRLQGTFSSCLASLSSQIIQPTEGAIGEQSPIGITTPPPSWMVQIVGSYFVPFMPTNYSEAITLNYPRYLICDLVKIIWGPLNMQIQNSYGLCSATAKYSGGEYG